jgi:hypothetical protein
MPAMDNETDNEQFHRPMGKGRVLLPPPPRAIAPIILSPEQNPNEVLAQIYNMAVLANSILVEQFSFDEVYRDYINIIRNDPDPKNRLAASDRLLKMIREFLINSGALAKVSEIVIRSPDGTTASRETITRRISRTFEEETRANQPQDLQDSPAPNPPAPTYSIEGAGPPGPA